MGRLIRLTMAVLIVLLAYSTYVEAAVAHARSSGTLDTTDAVVTEVTVHSTSGYVGGGGQTGSRGIWVNSREYRIELRVGNEVKTANRVQNLSFTDFHEGQRVEARLWHGRLVEIDGHNVWPGWLRGSWGVKLFVYPLMVGYAIGFALGAAAFLIRVRGGGWVDRHTLERFWMTGAFFAMMTGVVLIVFTLFGHSLSFWPAVPAGAGVLSALAGLRRKIRRDRTAAPADTTVAAG
ncbi:hypothetical protein [Streptomyces sp. HUAS ZL42]|uniref:hypothetical protein n=1 Tax=Streptomyces sp. HUAS ZL42 TaxID=3231715 RepID=UPI00345E0D83